MSKNSNAEKGGQLKRGALLSYFAIGFNAISGLLYTPWMVSSVGATDYGLYTLAMSIINLFLQDFGLGNAVSRFLSKYYAEGQDEKANLFLGIAYKTYAVLALAILLVFVVIYFNIDAIYANLPAEQVAALRRLFAIAAVYGVLSFSFLSFDGILISNERFVAINAVNLIQKIATVVFTVVALLFGMGVYALVLVNATVGLMSIVTKYILIKRLTRVKPNLRYFDKNFAREIFGFSSWVMVSQICQRCIFSILPTVLAMVANAEEVAIFGLAVSLEGYVWTVANALNGLMMPGVSRALTSSDRTELQLLMEKIGRIQVYIVGLLFVGFLSTGNLFVSCWMGEGYDALYACAILLIVPSLVELPQLVAGTAIVALGEVKKKACVFSLMAVLNVVLSIPLSALFGAYGASVSVCVSYLARTFGMNVLYRKTLRIDLMRYFRKAYGEWIIPACLATASGVFMGQVCSGMGWTSFVASALCVCSVYVVACYVLSFNQYEKALAKNVAKKFFRRLSAKWRSG